MPNRSVESAWICRSFGQFLVNLSNIKKSLVQMKIKNINKYKNNKMKNLIAVPGESSSMKRI